MKSTGEMYCQMIHRWTFSGLVGAFLDLTLAFFMLCGATAAFFATNLLEVFGQRLPCPCQGLFGRPSGQCLQEILAHSPPRKISQIQMDLRRQFPFNSAWAGEAGTCCHFDPWKDQNKNEAAPQTAREEDSCDSVSGWNGVEGDGKFHGSSVFRQELRRRRCNAAEKPRKSQLHDSPSETSPSHEGPQSSPGTKKTENSPRSIQQLIRGGILSGNEFEEGAASGITILERALEEERAARSALYLELEKERSAAATAADEAMAMILRLQKEKASIEMEARQFERIMEERSAYDEEEMNVLKEIIVRRERENHVLERELEMYRQTMLSADSELEAENGLLHTPNSLKNHNQDDPGASSEMMGTEDVSLTRTVKAHDSEDHREDDVHDVHMVAKGCDISLCDVFSESSGSRKVDRTRRYSGSACLEGRGNIHTSSSCSRRAILPVNMSYDSFSLSNFRRNSMSAVDKERSKLEAEVEFLRDRLKIIQNGREKLGLSEHKEKENCQLQLLEEIVSQLCAVRKLARPGKAMHRMSLDPLTSKV